MSLSISTDTYELIDGGKIVGQSSALGAWLFYRDLLVRGIRPEIFVVRSVKPVEYRGERGTRHAETEEREITPGQLKGYARASFLRLVRK
jgi:hypothetical protein